MKSDQFLLAFSLCLSVGYGLKCYGCFSNNGWADCERNQTVQTCGPDDDTCGKIHVEGTDFKPMYSKGCGSKSVCNPKTAYFCQGKEVTECQITCCSKDLCDAAQVSMVSVVLLLACAIVACFPLV